VLIGVAYMSLVGYRWLPSRADPALLTEFEIDSYLSRIVVSPEADLVGSSLRESWLADEGINVLAVERGGTKLFPRAGSRIEAGDALIVQASRQGLLELGDRPGTDFAELEWKGDEDLVAEDVRLAEAIIMPRSRLLGRTLRELRLRQRYGVSVLAIYRHGVSHPVEIADLPLAEADVLLLQGGEEGLALLQSNESVWVLGVEAPPSAGRAKRLITVAAFAAGVAAAALGVLPVAVAMLLAALIVVVTRCIDADEIYEVIDWRVIVLIGGMTSFGVAMQVSGTADYLADLIVVAAEDLGTYGLLAAFAVLTMILTQPLSNAAAVLVVMPVAVAAAGNAGIDPRPLAILVTLSASFSFIAPLEPACLLVYSAGRYRFSDFVKAGIPLTVIALGVLLVLVPWLWPLAPAGPDETLAPGPSGIHDRRDVPVTGMIGIPKACVQDGLLEAEEADAILESMVDAGYFSPVRRISDLL
jgi:di/tricarboxylate transporter